MADKLLPWMRHALGQTSQIASAALSMLHCSTQHSCRQEKAEKEEEEGGGGEGRRGEEEEHDLHLQLIDYIEATLNPPD